MIHECFGIRDTCVGAYQVPMFFVNSAAAVRALGDAVNRAKEDNAFYQHPEHYQLWHLGSFDDESGLFTPVAPVFVVDCQSLVRSA